MSHQLPELLSSGLIWHCCSLPAEQNALCLAACLAVCPPPPQLQQLGQKATNPSLWPLAPAWLHFSPTSPASGYTEVLWLVFLLSKVRVISVSHFWNNTLEDLPWHLPHSTFGRTSTLWPLLFSKNTCPVKEWWTCSAHNMGNSRKE